LKKTEKGNEETSFYCCCTLVLEIIFKTLYVLNEIDLSIVFVELFQKMVLKQKKKVRRNKHTISVFKTAKISKKVSSLVPSNLVGRIYYV